MNHKRLIGFEPRTARFPVSARTPTNNRSVKREILAVAAYSLSPLLLGARRPLRHRLNLLSLTFRRLHCGRCGRVDLLRVQGSRFLFSSVLLRLRRGVSTSHGHIVV